jgi:hypothetical protein
MPGTRVIVRSAAALMALLGLGGMAAGQAKEPGPKSTGPYGLPARLRNLTDLALLHRAKLTPLQNTEVALAWLAGELREPSPTTIGLGGGPVDTAYTLQEIITELSLNGDPAAMGLLLSSGQIRNDDVADAVRLALAYHGDGRQVQPVLRMLAGHSSPCFRILAAYRAARLGVLAAIPLLERALADEYCVAVPNKRTGEPEPYYPVREVAAGSLRALRNPDRVAAAGARCEAFARGLAARPLRRVGDSAVLKRLTLAANGAAQRPRNAPGPSAK